MFVKSSLKTRNLRASHLQSKSMHSKLSQVNSVWSSQEGSPVRVQKSADSSVPSPQSSSLSHKQAVWKHFLLSQSMAEALHSARSSLMVDEQELKIKWSSYLCKTVRQSCQNNRCLRRSGNWSRYSDRCYIRTELNCTGSQSLKIIKLRTETRDT